jgi:hypothetical protein
VSRSLEAYERRYVAGGAVRHLLVDALADAAVCGLAPWKYSLWHGTGSRVERDLLASLPDCKLCLRRRQ